MSTRNSKKPVKNNGHDLKDLLAVRECLNLLEQHKLAEAKKICQEILKRAPRLVFANHAMGLIAMEEEDFSTAETELRKALAADPDNAGYLTNLGKAVLKSNRIDDAIKLFEQAIAIDTDSKEARIGLANALHEKNDPDASIAYFEDAVRRAPDAPGPLSHLGSALIDAKRYQEAVATLLKALELQINFAPAHTNLGTAFQEMGMLNEAIECHKTSLLLDPKDIFAHNKMADTYAKLKDYDKVHEIYQQVIELAPLDANSYAKLASSYFEKQDRYDDAIQLFHKALEIAPRHALTHNNIGAVMHDHGDTDAAMVYFKQALQLKPDYTTALHNLALGQLLAGDFAEGWKNHESRLEVKERRAVYRVIHKLFALIPKWDGTSSLKGKYILLMHEQGFGDSIQFVRYVRILLEQGARVALHVKDPLARLFRSVSDQITLVRESDPIPQCDCAYVLMSLPQALGTNRIEDIPAYPSYLRANPAERARWAEKIDRLTNDKKALRVGVVWAGNPEHGNDRRRSIPLTTFAELFKVPGVQFYSLQKGKPSEELQTLPAAAEVISLGEEFTDFAVTAAAMDNLDLIISVDTSVVHLAGALGKPTWTLLSDPPDWRWLKERSDSPWYPSMRLIRQTTQGDWASVIAKTASDLADLRDSRPQ